MLLIQRLEAIVHAIDAQFAAVGWDAPAVLFAIESTVGDTTVRYTAELQCVLDGHPVTALLREHPVVPPDAIGAAVAVEGWTYSPAVRARLRAGETIPFPPSGDPDRVELRIVQLCLRDGTETRIITERDGTPGPHGEQSSGWVPALLRRSTGAPSQATVPGPELALRIAALCQLAHLDALASSGVPLPVLVEPAELARFTLPGLGALPAGLREAWWDAVEASLDGAPLDAAGLADGVRRALAASGWALPVARPFTRDEDAVVATPELLAWLDDALVCGFIDEVVPSAEVLVQALGVLRGPGWADALARRFAQVG